MIAHLLSFQMSLPLMCPDDLPHQGARFSDAAAVWDRPIELWVDERTASAAECLAGVLIAALSTSDGLGLASDSLGWPRMASDSLG